MASKMKLDIVLPHEFYDTLMVFITTFFMLWAIKAYKRFYYMLKVRASILQGRMIMIRGVSSYLSYFEDVSYSHANTIVHTRQTNPPVDMNILYVPITLNESSYFVNDKDSLIFHVNLILETKCQLILLIDCDSTFFRKLDFSNFLNHNEYNEKDLRKLFGAKKNIIFDFKSAIEGPNVFSFEIEYEKLNSLLNMKENSETNNQE